MSEPPPVVRVRKVHLIVNPTSGLSRGPGHLEAFRGALRGAGVEIVEQRTEGPGHARELAREACRHCGDALVAAGGDGTVNEVVNGMALASMPLATLPLGTSNILARDLVIPFDPVDAAGVVLGGRCRNLDVGLVNGRRFLMVVGVGWDAHVVNAVSRTRRGHLGKHRYLLPVGQAVLTYRFPRLTASIDGGPPVRATVAFACNTRNYAAFFSLTPDARPDDRKLDFLVLREGSRRDMVRWIWAAFAATLPRYRETIYRQGRELLVTADEPVPYQIDGDPGGTTPVRISMEQGTLEVIVP